MSSFENSNEKLMFFGIANFCSKSKVLFFKREWSRKTLWGVVHSFYIFPKVFEVPSNALFVMF